MYVDASSSSFLIYIHADIKLMDAGWTLICPTPPEDEAPHQPSLESVANNLIEAAVHTFSDVIH